MWFIIGGIASFFLQILAIVIPFLKPVLYKKVNKKGYVRDVPSKWGWIIIIASILSTGYGTVKELIPDSNKETLEYADLRICPTPNLNFTYNPTTITSVNFDSIKLQMWICNLGKKKAINLIDSSFFLYTNKDSCIFRDFNVLSLFNQTDDIPSNHSKLLNANLKIKNKSLIFNPDVQFYYYFILHYTDETNKNHVFEKLLKIDLKNMGKGMSAPNRNEFIKVKKCISIRKEMSDYNRKNQIEYAALNFCVAPNVNFKYNPTTKISSKRDSLGLMMWICNYGKKKAFNLIDTGYFFITLNDTCVFSDSTVMTSFNPSSYIQPNTGLMNYFNLRINDKGIITAPNIKFYFYYKLHYTDETNEHHMFDKILKVDWSTVQKEMYEPNRNEYIQLKKCISARTFLSR